VIRVVSDAVPASTDREPRFESRIAGPQGGSRQMRVFSALNEGGGLFSDSITGYRLPACLTQTCHTIKLEKMYTF